MKFSKKTIFFYLILCILVPMVSFVLGEFATRLYLVISGKGGYIWLPDYYLGRVHAPNSSFVYEEDFSKEFVNRRKTNSLGLIGEEVAIQKPKNTFRILVLGDSFTEALQVKEGKNFCEQLQYLLNSKLASNGKVYQVLNAGMSGYSPISEYLYLKRDLIKLSPDIVILQLFANDVFDDHKAKAVSVVDEEGLPIKLNNYFTRTHLRRLDQNNSARAFQENCLNLYRFILQRSKMAQAIARAWDKSQKRSLAHQEFNSRKEFDDGNQFFIIQRLNPLFQDEGFRQKAWADTEKYILEIRNLAQQYNARLLIVLIPHEAQLYLKDKPYKPLAYFSQPPNLNFNNLVGDLCQRQRIDLIDLLSISEINKKKQLYFAKDGHLTEAGHELVSRVLFYYFKE